MSRLSVALVAILSSVTTVAAIEFLRVKPQTTPAIAGGLGPGEAGAESLRLAVRDGTPATPGKERFAELERRIAALELEAQAVRAPVALADAKEPPTSEELRALVLGWVDDEREARAQAEQLAAQHERQRILEQGAKHEARSLALEHTLTQGEEEAIWKLLLEVELRREALEAELDPRPEDPEEFERRWAEFDEWAGQRYRGQLGQSLVDELFSDD